MNRYPKPSPLTSILFWRARAVFLGGESSNEIRKIRNSGVIFISVGYACVKALANEDTLLRTHCCRHKCFSVCPRAQHLLRTQKMFLILFRNILCPQQMFPSLRWQGNVISNNVSLFSTALTTNCFTCYSAISEHITGKYKFLSQALLPALSTRDLT